MNDFGITRIVSAGILAGDQIFVDLETDGGETLRIALDPMNAPALTAAVTAALQGLKRQQPDLATGAIEVSAIEVGTATLTGSNHLDVLFRIELGNDAGELMLSTPPDVATQVLDGTLSALAEIGHPLAKRIRQIADEEDDTLEGEPLAGEALPRCGSALRLVPGETIAGPQNEAAEITVTDGIRSAAYVPVEIKGSTH